MNANAMERFVNQEAESLRLKIQQEGRDAFAEGKSRTANPYTLGRALAWDHGFAGAQRATFLFTNPKD